jgi:hypothetical protein
LQDLFRKVSLPQHTNGEGKKLRRGILVDDGERASVAARDAEDDVVERRPRAQPAGREARVDHHVSCRSCSIMSAK